MIEIFVYNSISKLIKINDLNISVLIDANGQVMTKPVSLSSHTNKHVILLGIVLMLTGLLILRALL